MIDHTAELVDALEAARPNLSAGEYEARRRHLDEMIRHGEVIELSAVERGVQVALMVGILAVPIAFLLLVHAIGGHPTIFVWLVCLLAAILCGIGARYVGRHGIKG